MAFSKRTIEHLPIPEDSRRDTYLDADPPGATTRKAVAGLQLTVSRAGTKSFVLCRKFNGRTKKITLDRFPSFTIEQARKKAMALTNTMVNEGKDPIQQRRAARQRSVTLGEVYREYMSTRGGNLSRNTIANYKTILTKYFDDWTARELASISRDMVQRRHQDITKLSPSSANKAMRVLRLEHRRQSVLRVHQLGAWMDAMLLLKKKNNLIRLPLRTC